MASVSNARPKIQCVAIPMPCGSSQLEFCFRSRLHVALCVDFPEHAAFAIAVRTHSARRGLSCLDIGPAIACRRARWMHRCAALWWSLEPGLAETCHLPPLGMQLVRSTSLGPFGCHPALKWSIAERRHQSRLGWSEGRSGLRTWGSQASMGLVVEVIGHLQLGSGIQAGWLGVGTWAPSARRSCLSLGGTAQMRFA